MVYLLKAAIALAERSDNTFNPAIGHLIRLWGFQNDHAADHEPDPAQIHHWVDANPRMSDLRYDGTRSEEHTTELQSLMRISYAVFCLKKKTTNPTKTRKTRNTIRTNK